MPTKKQSKKTLKPVSVSIRFSPADHAIITKAFQHNKKAGGSADDSFQRFVRNHSVLAANKTLQVSVFDASSIASTPADK